MAFEEPVGVFLSDFSTPGVRHVRSDSVMVGYLSRRPGITSGPDGQAVGVTVTEWQTTRAEIERLNVQVRDEIEVDLTGHPGRRDHERYQILDFLDREGAFIYCPVERVGDG